MIRSLLTSNPYRFCFKSIRTKAVSHISALQSLLLVNLGHTYFLQKVPWLLTHSRTNIEDTMKHKQTFATWNCPHCECKLSRRLKEYVLARKQEHRLGKIPALPAGLETTLNPKPAQNALNLHQSIPPGCVSIAALEKAGGLPLVEECTCSKPFGPRFKTKMLNFQKLPVVLVKFNVAMFFWTSANEVIPSPTYWASKHLFASKGHSRSQSESESILVQRR